MLTKSASMSALSSLVSQPSDWRAFDVYADGRHMSRSKISSISPFPTQPCLKVPIVETSPSSTTSRSTSRNNLEMECDFISSQFIRRAQSETDLQSLSRSLNARITADGLSSVAEGSGINNGVGVLEKGCRCKSLSSPPPSSTFINFEGDISFTQRRFVRSSRRHSFSSLSRRHPDVEVLEGSGFSSLSLKKRLALFSANSPFNLSLPCNGSLMSPASDSSSKISLFNVDSVHCPSSLSLLVDSVPLETQGELNSEFKPFKARSPPPSISFSKRTPRVPLSHPRASDEFSPSTSSSSSSSFSSSDSPSSSPLSPSHLQNAAEALSCSCSSVHCFVGSSDSSPPSGSSVQNRPLSYSSYRREAVSNGGEDWCGSVQPLDGGVGGGITGGKGGKGAGGSQDWEESSQGNTDSSGADAYYRRALDLDPGHPLLLRNYARFLFEVQRDLSKAEEFYERAILANPGDGEVLAQYAKLIWEAHKDNTRAGIYFEQAIQAAPSDCYVLAAYASFLWSADSVIEELPPDSLKEEQHCPF